MGVYLALEPDLVEARLALFTALPNGEEKRAQLDTLPRIAPDHPSILLHLGRVPRGAGDLDAAIGLGTYIYLARGDTVRARAAIARMLRETPGQFYVNAEQDLLLLPERLLGPEEREAAYIAYFRPERQPRDRRTSAAIHETAMGRTDAARAGWQSLRTYLKSQESPPREYLALAYMGLDDRNAALELARWWEDQIAAEERGEATAQPPQLRAPDGWDFRTHFGGLTFCPILARICTHFGRHDRPIDLLEEMLPAPSWMTVHILEVDPIWDPLRENPRFEALLEEYADDVEH